MQRLMTNKCAGQVVFWASLTFLMQAIGADIPQKSAEGCASNKLEILQNGNFDEIVPFEKNIEKWDIVGKKLPKSWVPVYSYGEAKAEVVPIANGSTNYELRLAHGALEQRLAIKPSSAERILDISFELRGKKTSGFLVRVNGKDCVSVGQLTEEMHCYRGYAVIKPGEPINSLSIWNHNDEIRIDNISAKLAEASVDAQSQIKKAAIPEGTITATTWLKPGANGLELTLHGQDGSSNKITLHSFSLLVPCVEECKGTTVLARVLPDAGIDITGLHITGLQGAVRKYVRPHFNCNKPEIQKDYIAKWDTLPSACEYKFPLTFRRNGERLECLVDHQYACSIAAAGGLKEIVFSCPEGSLAEETICDSIPVNEKFLPLALGPMNQPGKMKDAEITMTDKQLFKAIPFVQPTSANLDLGLTAKHKELFANYTFRNVFDNIKESFLFSVPCDQYIRAWVLCAVENDPAKDPSLTARLTRFVAGGQFAGRTRESLADTTVQLPRGAEKPAEAIRRAGTVTVKGEKVPLWLVEIQLKSGNIQDIIFDDKGPKIQHEPVSSNLDFEVLGRLTPWTFPMPDTPDARHFPLAAAVSGVHVFGITLERPPVEMEVRQSQVGNIFNNDEKPELPVALRVRQEGEYLLSWTIRDVDGEKVGGGAKKMTLKAGEGERIVPISLVQPELGWYEIVFEIKQDQRVLLSHTASFALLGPDTRQAGFESPFSTSQWPYHYCPKDLKINGPLVLKAGFRRCGGMEDGGGHGWATEADCAPWKFTIVCGPLAWPKFLLEKGATDEEIKKYISDALTRWPHCNHTMILYESYPAPNAIAPELIGLKPDPKNERPGADKRFEQAMRYAKIVRENFPQLKIFIGNSLGSSELIAELLRRKFPEAYADYLGVETVGRNGQPEKLWDAGFQSAWLMRAVARKYGYNKWGVTCCQEVNYRQDRLLGQKRQAEWYVRDAMLAFAYGCPLINIGVVYDAGNTYNSSVWGGTGFCRRYPFLYPKKSYVAMATVTRVLDRVKFIREMPTSCNSVYALEFTRPDGKNVYAIWAGRGTAELKLIFNQGVEVEIVDMYGRSRETATFWKRLSMTAQTAVQYLVTEGKIDTISSGRRTYPEDIPPDNLQVVAAMDKADDWQLVTGQDPLLEKNNTIGPYLSYLPYRTAGKFSLRQVQDAEKGDCLEVELHPRTDLPDIMSEYAVIRLKKPIMVPGTPTTLGLWVKGNSGWGEVYWEIEDAKGVRRLSCAMLCESNQILDYDGLLCTINFEGWNFLCMPITEKSPVADLHLPIGSVPILWNASKGSKGLAYPIKVTGIAVSLPPKAFHLTEMRPIRQIIRLKDLSVYE